MKIRILTASMLLALFGVPAVAGQNIFQEFLNRYRPSRGQAQWPALPQDQAVRALVGNALPLTVESTVRLLLESNLDVRVGRYSPLMNQYAIVSAFRLFEPTLRIGASVNRSTRPTITQLDGSAAPSSLGHNYSISYSQMLRTGADIDVDFSVNRSSSNSVFSTFNPSYSGVLTYSARQPLLRGWGRDIITNGIRVAKNNKDISDVEFEIQLIDIVTQAQLMYWDLVNAQEEIKVQERSLALAQKTLADNRRQIEVGTLAPIEVVQAEAVVASREEQMIVSSFSNDQLQNRMKRLITHVASPAFVLAKLNPIEAARRPNPADTMLLEEAVKYALESRPELRRMDLQMKSNEMDVKFTKNQLLPQVDVFASYTQSGIGGVETIRSGLGDNSIIDVRRGGFRNALEQMFGYNFTGYAVGLSVSIPLSNKSAQADYTRIITQQHWLQDQRAARVQAITLEVQNAHSQVEMNRASIVAAGKSLELAKRQLAAEERKNQLGVSPIRFVLDAQRDMTDAETREIQAVIQYTQALARYDQAVGRTLRKNNIGIEQELRLAED